MNKSLMLVANEKESERTDDLLLLDDSLLDLIAGGASAAIKCPSNEYAITHDPNNNKFIVDCVD